MELIGPLVAGDPAASIVAFHVERRRRRGSAAERRREPLVRHLDELDRLAREAGAPALTRRTDSGDPAAEVILREAARSYDLLVLGASEATRRHPLGGEYVRAIAAATPCPLLVVRSGPSERHLPGRPGPGDGRAAHPPADPRQPVWTRGGRVRHALRRARRRDHHRAPRRRVVLRDLRAHARRRGPRRDHRHRARPCSRASISGRRAPASAIRTEMLEAANVERALLRAAVEPI